MLPARLAYDHLRLAEPDGSLPVELDQLLADPEVVEVVARNVLAGRDNFRVTRAG